MPSSGPLEPIVETPTHEPRREETGDRALRLRVRQQEILAELGVTALKGTPFDDLLKEAVLLCAQGLEAEFCKVLEYIPAACERTESPRRRSQVRTCPYLMAMVLRAGLGNHRQGGRRCLPSR